MSIKASKKMGIDDVLRAIQPILPIIQDATRYGNWDGIGGVKEYIDPTEKNRVALIEKQYGPKVSNQALELCLLAVIEGARSSHNMHVLRLFAERYTKVVINLAEKAPEVFHSPDVAMACMNSLGGRNGKKFIELVEKSRSTEQNNKTAEIGERKGTFTKLVEESRKQNQSNKRLAAPAA